MKKGLFIILCLLMFLMGSGFRFDINDQNGDFDLDNLKNYQKEFNTEEMEVCATSDAKTYMDYRTVTYVGSVQYTFIHNNLTVDRKTGFLYDEDGFIAVALGTYYGQVGDRFYFTLDSGIVIPVVKAEVKDDGDTDYSGCYQKYDGSIIEFVIDTDYAGSYFGYSSNGYIMNGNYNNFSLFRGNIVKVEKVLDEPNEDYVTYVIDPVIPSNVDDVFNYASGY